MAQTHSWDIDITGADGGICQWITDHGGPDNFTGQDLLLDLGNSLLTGNPVSGYNFTMTPLLWLGAGAYWLHPHTAQSKQNGNSYTGCAFI